MNLKKKEEEREEICVKRAKIKRKEMTLSENG